MKTQIDHISHSAVVTIAELAFDPKALQSAYFDLLGHTPFSEKNQILLNSHDPDRFDPFCGVGSLYCSNNNPKKFNESDFRYFNPYLKETYFEKIYHAVSAFWPESIGRIRLMKLPPKSCYSVHIDDGYRLHFPILTSGQCFLCFPEEGMFHLPANGTCFLTNTLKEHSAMNGSLVDRVHLVISLSRLADQNIFNEEKALYSFLQCRTSASSDLNNRDV